MHMNEEISYHIIMLAHAHRRWAEEALNKLGLHTGQEHILFLLYQEDGLTATQLTARFNVGLATIVKSIQRMERVGIVVRRQTIMTIQSFPLKTVWPTTSR
jgi:DNA-binding MarR family transcriptional regulator